MPIEDAAEGSVVDGALPESQTSEAGVPTEGAGSEAESSSGEEPFLYDVLVDGKTEKVTFDELQKGYMRQRDYTQKTQTVARQREELAQMSQLAAALEQNPQQTIIAMAGYYGVSLGQAEKAFEQKAGDEDDPIARLERGVNNLTQQFQSQQQSAQQAAEEASKRSAAEAQVKADLAQLRQNHGEFPEMELIQYAVAHGINNLDAAYRAWQFDVLNEKSAAEKNAAVEAKRRAQIVAGGSNPQAGSVVKGSSGNKPSFREAFQLALDSQNR